MTATPKALLAAAEAALAATHTRRAQLADLRSKLISETGKNELAMTEAKARLKAVKKYSKEWNDWVDRQMRTNPHISFEQHAAACPILPPE